MCRIPVVFETFPVILCNRNEAHTNLSLVGQVVFANSLTKSINKKDKTQSTCGIHVQFCKPSIQIMFKMAFCLNTIVTIQCITVIFIWIECEFYFKIPLFVTIWFELCIWPFFGMEKTEKNSFFWKFPEISNPALITQLNLIYFYWI